MIRDLELRLETREQGGQTVALIHAVGEIDLGNADELEAMLGSQECAGSDRIVVDLLEVPFMDSSGLRVLLLAAEAERELGVALTSDSPVLRLLELAEVTDRVTIYESREQALDGNGADASHTA